MKNRFRFFLALALLAALTACGGGADDAPASDAGVPPAAAVDAPADAGDLPDRPTDVPADTGALPDRPSDAPADGDELPDKPVDKPAAADPEGAPADGPEGKQAAAPAAAPEQPSADPEGAPAGPALAEAAAEADPEAPAGVSLADVRSKIVSDLGISDYMEITASRMLDLYGIQEADLAQSGSFATMSGVFPGEVILVEAVDKDAAARVAGLLQARLDELLNQYKTYDAETYALAEACTVDTNGNFVSMLLSPEGSKMREILAASLS